MKQILFLATTILLATTTQAGIYRHDVSPEKYRELARNKQFDCVGQVIGAEGTDALGGSCVLIGKRYVLSAAHVFVVAGHGKDTTYFDSAGKKTTHLQKGGRTVIVNLSGSRQVGKLKNYTFKFNERTYNAKNIKIYQSYIDSAENYNYFCGDLALIELTDTVAGIEPATLNRSYNELGMVITGVGYGVSGPADKPDDVGPHNEKIAGQNTVDEIIGFRVNGRHAIMSCDFDHPTRNDCNKMGSANPLELEYTCGGGDSGGGIFIQHRGKYLLAGITTGGPNSGINIDQLLKTGYYGQIMQTTRISVFYDWIQETIKGFKKETKNGY